MARIELQDLNEKTVAMLQKSIEQVDTKDTRSVKRLCESVRDLNVIIQKDEHLQAMVELDRIRTALVNLASGSSDCLSIEESNEEGKVVNAAVE